MPDQEREFKWNIHLDRFHVHINHTHMMMACDNNHGGDIMITSSEKCHRVVNLWGIVPWLDHSHSPPHVSSFSWTSSYHHAIPSKDVTRIMTIFIIITLLECFGSFFFYASDIHFSPVHLFFIIILIVKTDMESVKNFTHPDFQAKNFTPQKCVICDSFFAN